MQTFSSMRRNSTHQNFVASFFIFVVLFITQILSSLYPWIPPLSGFCFAYVILATKQGSHHKFNLFMVLLYLSFYDVYQGFYPFSYLMLVLISELFGLDRIEQMTSCEKCILMFYIVIGYFGHFALNFLLAYILNAPLPYFSSNSIYWIGFDAILAFIFLKVRR